MARKEDKDPKESGEQKRPLLFFLILLGFSVVLYFGVIGNSSRLITNAKVQSTVDRVELVNGAVSRFLYKFREYPGDIKNSESFSEFCSGMQLDCLAGDGDGLVGKDFSEAIANSYDFFENELFWVHLKILFLEYPLPKDIRMAEVGGQFHLIYHGPQQLLPGTHSDSPHEEGHYLFLTGADRKAIGNFDLYAITPRDARQLDLKLDDGMPDTGRIVAIGDDSCFVPDGTSRSYDRKEDKRKCVSLYIKTGF